MISAKILFVQAVNLLFSKKMPAYLSALKPISILMSLKTFVKINRITNLTDARYCAGMHADLLGFCLEEGTTHFLTPKQFEEITGWVSGIAFAAEFNNSSAYQIQNTLNHYEGITWIESEHLEPLLELVGSDLKLLYKQDIKQVKKLENSLGPILQKHLIKLHLTSTNNSLTPDDQEIIQTYSRFTDVILGFGISPTNASDLSEKDWISGLALNGGDEIKPGLRDFDQLAEILENLEIED